MGRLLRMSDPDEEKGGPQVVPDGPPGTPSEPTPVNEETERRRAAEHGERPDDVGREQGH